MAAKTQRFAIRTTAGAEPVPNATTLNAALSKALTLATRADGPGVWDVLEWDDVLYRVVRGPEEKATIYVQVAA